MKRPPRVSRARDVRGGCQGCPAAWRGDGTLASARAHRVETGHETFCETTNLVTFEAAERPEGSSA